MRTTSIRRTIFQKTKCPCGGSVNDRTTRFFCGAPMMIQPLESRTLFDSSISGTVFNDLNADGTQNAGEAGLANQTVFLDQNFDGAFDAGDISLTTDVH